MHRASMPVKARWRTRDAWAIIVLANFLILALLLLLALIYLNPPFALGEQTMIVFMSVFLLVVVVWSLWSWRALTGSLFNPYALFLIAAALFNGGRAFLEIFNLNENGIVDGKLSPETTLETLFIVTLGLAALHAGGLFSVPMYKRKSLGKETEKRNAIPTAKALRLVGWGLLAISLVPAILLLRDSIAVVVSSGYLGLFRQAPVYGFNAAPRILASFIVPGTLFLLAGSKGFRFNIALSGVVILGYSSTMFFLGDRHEAVLLLIACAWVYHRCIRPIPSTLLLIVGSLILFVVFPVISVFRHVSGGNRLSLTALWDAFTSIDNPVVAILSEMGFSIETVAYTINLVPSYRNYDLGTSYLYALFSVFPNLFWRVHPTEVHGTLDKWLIAIVDPARDNVSSIAFSFIAEAYLNFGWFGAPLSLGIIGFLLGWFVLWADKSADPAKIAMVGSFTGFFLIYARGESNEVIRFLVWYALIPYLGVCVLRPLIRPSSIRRQPSSNSKGYDGLAKGKGVV